MLPGVARREALEALSAAAADAEGDAYLRHHRHRLALDLQWLIDHVEPSAAILEIGAAPYYLTRAAARLGYRLQTVDYPSAETERAARSFGIASHACDIERERLPFADETFDEVLFNEVFEHLRIDPPFTVAEILRVLRPGGRLWLSTPNLLSLRGWINLVVRQEAWSVSGGGVYRQYQPLRRNEPVLHVREYTGPEIRAFLRAAGFDVVALEYRGRFSNPAAGALCRVVPRLRPYFSIIARKPRPPPSR